jgi:hypothetical protein
MGKKQNGNSHAAVPLIQSLQALQYIELNEAWRGVCMNIRIFCPPVDLHLAKEIQLWLTRPWPGSLRQQPPSLTHSLTPPSFAHASVVCRPFQRERPRLTGCSSYFKNLLFIRPRT